MKIAIAGGSGFVGTALIDELSKENHDIYILTRHPEKFKKQTNLTYINWLAKEAQPEKHLAGLDVFINLAGESLNSGRWTPERKRRIVESRVEASKEMNRIISMLPDKLSVIINASAVGYYGISDDETFTETSGSVGDDFLARTVQLWEKEAAKSRSYSNRLVLTRFGVILGEKDGALPMMVLPYKLFGGGKMGKGNQWLSWIHIHDVVRAIIFCMNDQRIEGPVNFTAPNPVQMDTFGKTIGAVLHRPHWLPVPPIFLKKLLGEMSILVLEGQNVLPTKLKDEGFTFSFPILKEALQNILNEDSHV
ncbi:TIGR01777 family oxidoreductase [Peribacillus simplex]|uniref:TIGR01777 family oxidoreductase n=1 Tax=Peribacillus TaxID=2675229 RepID=UPI00177FC190|nr:TIGR01777 family oxidoreductase [Brevibacillus sp. JNUCC-41]QOS92709.1 TIGR01777 family protein [Brevibacillus sp. JNUCC-41]